MDQSPILELQITDVVYEHEDAIVFDGSRIPTVAAAQEPCIIFYLTEEDEQNGYGTVIRLDPQTKQAAIFSDLNPEYTYLFYRNEQAQIQTLLWCIEFASRTQDGMYVTHAKVHGRGVTAEDMARLSEIKLSTTQPPATPSVPEHQLTEAYTPQPLAPAQPTPAPSFAPSPAPVAVPAPPPVAQPTATDMTPIMNERVLPFQTAPLVNPSAPQVAEPTPIPQPATYPVATTAPITLEATSPTPAVNWATAALPPTLSPTPAPPAPATPAPVVPPEPSNQPDLLSQFSAPLPTPPQPEPAPAPPVMAPAPAPMPLPAPAPTPPNPVAAPVPQASAEAAADPAQVKLPVGRPPKPLIQDQAWLIDSSDFTWIKSISRDLIGPNQEELRDKVIKQIRRNQPNLLEDWHFTGAFEQAFLSLCQVYDLVPATRHELLKALLNGKIMKQLQQNLQQQAQG